jgi:hypothetical protein
MKEVAFGLTGTVWNGGSWFTAKNREKSPSIPYNSPKWMV